MNFILILNAICIVVFAGIRRIVAAFLTMFVVWGTFVNLEGLTMIVGGHAAFWWKVSAFLLMTVWLYRKLDFQLKWQRMGDAGNTKR